MKINIAQKITLVVVVVIWGVTFAFALLPLPRQSFDGVTVGTCGPGMSSSSALYLKLFPGQADANNPLASGETPQQHSQWISLCKGVANDRLWKVFIIGLGTLVLGGIVFVIFGIKSRGLTP